MTEELFNGSLSEIPEIEKMLNSPYAPILQEACASLKHDKIGPHVKKAMLYGALLAMLQKLSKEDAKLLLTICAYHEIGRRGDRWEPDHGARGAMMLEELETGLTGEELKIAQAVIASAPEGAEPLEGYLSLFEIEDRDRCRLMSELLHDADRLDVMLPIYCKELKCPESKQLADLTAKIYWWRV